MKYLLYLELIFTKIWELMQSVDHAQDLILTESWERSYKILTEQSCPICVRSRDIWLPFLPKFSKILKRFLENLIRQKSYIILVLNLIISLINLERILKSLKESYEIKFLQYLGFKSNEFFYKSWEFL